MKLHVGCGSIHIPGYINIDIRYLPNVDVVDNAKFLRKFENKGVEEIYACHVLEHFSRWDVKIIIERWYKLLSSNGILFVSVPDFGAIVSYYQRTKDIEKLIGFLYGGQDYEENFHYYCWDFDSLKKDLKEIGFTNICRYDWKDSPFKDFDDYSKAYLPHKDFESGELMSLNVRAVK